jgi:hypothetical protein
MYLLNFQLLSLNYLREAIYRTWGRFPMSIVCAFAGTFLYIFIIETHPESQSLSELVQVFVLGITTYLALDLYTERNPVSTRQKSYWQVGIAFLLILYFFFQPERQTIVHSTRYALLFVGSHLSVSFAPYVFRTEYNGFWQYNQRLFLRLLIVSIYSLVLFIGISVALLALDQLFGVRIPPQRYMECLALIVGIFNTMFYLAGIPDDFEALEIDTSYPNPLLIFTQYVLLPLIALYLVILYSYGLKILLWWNLPRGWVANLVIVFAGVGIFSLLLIYPIREKAENHWIKRYARWFYRGLLPLIVLLFVAIGWRIADYGLTEFRYLVLLTAFWLAGIAIYFLQSHRKRLQVIPISLCMLCFFASFGYWGAFYLSEKSQVLRFGYILQKNNLLKNSKIQRQIGNKHQIAKEDLIQIGSILNYLIERESLAELQPYFHQNLNKILDNELNTYAKEERVLDLIGDKSFRAGIGLPDFRQTIDFATPQTAIWEHIKGFDYRILIELSTQVNPNVFVNLDTYQLKVKGLLHENKVQIALYPTNSPVIDFHIETTIQNLLKNHEKKPYQVPAADLGLLAESVSYRAKLQIQSIGIIRKNRKEFESTQLKAILLIQFL